MGDHFPHCGYDMNMSDTILYMAGSDRLSAEDWVEASLQVLVEGGVAAVKILPIAQRLGVTRGSFYWHFTSRSALLSRLLDTWEAKNTAAIVKTATAAGALVDKYVALSRLWLGWSDFDPRLDVAVRDWGHRDAAVRKRLQLADEERVAALVAMIEPEGYDPVMARHRAYALYCMQMGWYDGDEGAADGRGESSVTYFEIFIGRAPSPAERAAIVAGHRSP
ncbi:MAG: TetR/AcrR family transcriptional regulator [Acidimicrobiaceae bacterium]|nr:TetR/AcrR family transcriptional regulator [Acidimicrobiaceae bacterium]MCY3643998.1 TetR/AcrR family transcriptional regulator [Acidimicrobiaceae bacterium]MXY11368.1 TetR/AcrR family transcriptional regulator [Acidimicrobiaceae bacterium]MXZ64405.1 TetR/AcrR family transcriptional regulator [Acidimicrobiaceae bacterium]MYA13358.1 TetR/AcrR family transcriptional regulator [Acidimicrobiaceae bacterium]